MRVARSHGLEDRLGQRQARLSAEVFEGYRHGRFGTLWLAFRIGPVACKNEAFRLDDLAIHALRPMVGAVGAAHVDAIGGARAKVDLANDRARETFWAPPANHVFGIGPGLENKTARGIEDARDDEFEAFGFSHAASAISCFHFSSPSTAIRASTRRGGRGSLPRSADS